MERVTYCGDMNPSKRFIIEHIGLLFKKQISMKISKKNPNMFMFIMLV